MNRDEMEASEVIMKESRTFNLAGSDYLVDVLFSSYFSKTFFLALLSLAFERILTAMTALILDSYHQYLQSMINHSKGFSIIMSKGKVVILEVYKYTFL